MVTEGVYIHEATCDITGGLRASHHVGQDHAAHPARGRGAVGAGVAAGQVPRAARHAARAARAHAEPRHRRLMSADTPTVYDTSTPHGRAGMLVVASHRLPYQRRSASSSFGSSYQQANHVGMLRDVLGNFVELYLQSRTV